MKDFKLAWRNLWRNKRRSFITIASILFGVLISTIMTSVQHGMYAAMIDNVVSFYSGYMQIHHPEYWETKSIDYLFQPEDEQIKTVEGVNGVDVVVPRLESFALMSFGTQTKGGMVIGIDPEKENEFTGLEKWIADGSYLSPESDGILMAVNLARNLGVGIGDTVALISQGYHGVGAAMLFPVTGILEFPTPAMNSIGTYITISKAQEFFSAPQMVTSLVLTVDNYEEVKPIKNELQQKLGADLSVMTWDEMDPTVIQMINSGKGKGLMIKGILYVLIGFGILSTIVMMIAERRKELGVMVAIGMRKARLIRVLLIETLLIGLVGLSAGFAASMPLIFSLAGNPIPVTGPTAETYESMGMEAAVFFSADWPVFFNQLLIIFVITILVGIYPINKVWRLQVTNALRA